MNRMASTYSGVAVGVSHPCSKLYSIPDCPAFARLVVTNITPEAALEPYIDADAASFNTEILSISLGLMELISSIGTPSRSEERRVGKECVSTCRYRWSP